MEGELLTRREGIRRGRQLRIFFNTEEVECYEGETVAAALLASGRQVLRRTARRGDPRGVFCGMGVCFDCLVQIDGRSNRQACLTTVADGMQVETQLADGSGGFQR